MATPRVGRKFFERSYEGRIQNLSKFARTLPDRPSPDEIHDLRVAVRRLQVMRRLLPKETRGSEVSRRFGLALRSVLKATSPVRDLDTLRVTLVAHEENLPAEIIVNLDNQRSDAAAGAKGAIGALVDVPAPVESSMIKGKKLSKKLRKRIKKQSRTVVSLLARTLDDESKVQELHTLRKEVKKLRYLLELDKNSPRDLSVLTDWQESLGAVHDLDVAVSYLEGLGIDLNRKAIGELRRARHQSYLRFITEYRTDSAKFLANSDVLVGGPVLRPD